MISPPGPVELLRSVHSHIRLRHKGEDGVRTTTETRMNERVATRAVLTALVLLALAATVLVAQRAPTSLTLEEAITLAKGNNPLYLSTQNDMAAANWQTREAYAAFLPTVNVSGTAAYQEAGIQRLGALEFEAPTDWAFSSYSMNFNMAITGNTIFGIANARANKRATEASVRAAEWSLETSVALQYTAALRSMDQVDVAQRRLDRARQNLRIVNTRVETGAAAGIEGRQAEVDLGRAEVVMIQAQRDVRQSKLLLAERLGVALDVDVELARQFDVFEPDFEVGPLIDQALAAHPSLRAVAAQESASKAAARQISTSQYLPSLFLNTRLSGFARQALNEDFVASQVDDQAASRMGNCAFNNAINGGLPGGLPGYVNQDCSQFVATDAARAAALDANRLFPFNFSPNPVTLTAIVSLPIFTGFTGQRQVSQANNAAEDAEHARRAEELRLRTAVTNAYDNLVSAYRVIQVEARNQSLSEEQLQLQQRRYALGAAGLLELMDAQTTVTTSDQLYLNALYDFQFNLIALEAAVGRPLPSRN